MLKVEECKLGSLVYFKLHHNLYEYEQDRESVNRRVSYNMTQFGHAGRGRYWSLTDRRRVPARVVCRIVEIPKPQRSLGRGTRVVLRVEGINNSNGTIEIIGDTMFFKLQIKALYPVVGELPMMFDRQRNDKLHNKSVMNLVTIFDVLNANDMGLKFVLNKRIDLNDPSVFSVNMLTPNKLTGNAQLVVHLTGQQIAFLADKMSKMRLETKV